MECWTLISCYFCKAWPLDIQRYPAGWDVWVALATHQPSLHTLPNNYWVNCLILSQFSLDLTQHPVRKLFLTSLLFPLYTFLPKEDCSGYTGTDHCMYISNSFGKHHSSSLVIKIYEPSLGLFMWVTKHGELESQCKTGGKRLAYYSASLQLKKDYRFAGRKVLTRYLLCL